METPPRRLIVRKLLNEPYHDLATTYINEYNRIEWPEEAVFTEDLVNYLDGYSVNYSDYV